MANVVLVLDMLGGFLGEGYPRQGAWLCRVYQRLGNNA